MIRRPAPKKKGRARIPVRKSGLCLYLVLAATLLLGLMFTHAHLKQLSDAPAIARVAAVVGGLELTDLALFTEARYTRHPSQTDLYSAFQDHPASLEHFPLGSLAGPPAALRRMHGTVD